jgi:hypothetical protein
MPLPDNPRDGNTSDWKAQINFAQCYAAEGYVLLKHTFRFKQKFQSKMRHNAAINANHLNKLIINNLKINKCEYFTEIWNVYEGQ